MAEVKVRKTVGPQGLAHLQIMKNGARVTFEDGAVFDVQKPDIDIKNGRYNITLTTDRTKIFGIRPPVGQVIVQFKGWGNRVMGKMPGSSNKGLPASKILPATVGHKADGSTFPILSRVIAIAEFEVVRGPYEGLTVSTMLPYAFHAPESGDMTDYVEGKKNLLRVENFFLCVTGKPLTDIDIEYSDDSTTLLLRYEKMMLANNHPFLGNINEMGFLNLDTISPLPADLMPTKKSAAKRAKKSKK